MELKPGQVELVDLTVTPKEGGRIGREGTDFGYPFQAIAWIPARAIGARTRSGEVIWILTTVDAQQLPAIAIMGLYRLRWQIELLFKRLKSLLHLDTLPSREGPTAKSWMLSRLIAAGLAQRLVQPSGPLFPWGYELRSNPPAESTHA